MLLQVPDVDVHIDYYKRGKVKGEYKTPIDWLRGNLFGGQDYEGNFHNTCFNDVSLFDLFKRHGMEVTKVERIERAIKLYGVKK